MAKRVIRHMDFECLVDINRQVVALTGEPHGYSQADREKLSGLLKEVEQRADNQEFDEAVPDKATLLVFRVASGQYFQAGNKRTALVAGLAFLLKNGRKIDIEDPEFVSTADRVGMAAATLDDLYRHVQRLLVKSPAERKGWDKVVRHVVDSKKDFLTKMAESS